MSFSDLARGLAGASPPRGAGAVAAGVAELTAGLCEAITRHSLTTWPEARGVAVQAAALRARAAEAGQANTEAYGRARHALNRAVRPGETGRDAELRAELIGAAETLLGVAAVAADCAGLAAAVAHGAAAEWRGDAAGAAELATAATHAATGLVEVNLALLPEDERRERARRIAAAADTERERARQAAGEI